MSTALARRPRPLAEDELIGLAKYDAMVRTIAECHEVDEVKHIHDAAAALERYSKEAKNYENELRAMDIRIRASEQAGKLIDEGQKAGIIATPGPPTKQLSSLTTINKPRSLTELGITRDQSSQWKQLAGIDPKDIEEHLPMKTGKRTSIKKIIKAARPKRDPEAEHQQELRTIALRVWGRLRDLPEVTENFSLKEVVGAMDKQLLDGVWKFIPKVTRFLDSLEKEINRAKKEKND